MKRSALGVVLALLCALVVVGVSPLLALASYAYQTAQLAESPSGYWPLDDGSTTTANDASGHGHALTLTSASWEAAGMVSGSGASFLGNGSAFADTTAGIPFGGGTTMIVWFAESSTSSTQWIFQAGMNGDSTYCPDGGSANRYAETLYIDSGGDIHYDDLCAGLAENVGTCTHGMVGLSTFGGGVPHMLAFTNSGGTGHLYVDGASCSSGSTVNAIGLSSHVTVGAGCNSSSCGFFPLLAPNALGQAAIVPSVLSSSDVATLYGSRSPTATAMFIKPDPSYIAFNPAGGESVDLGLSSIGGGSDTTAGDTFTFTGGGPGPIACAVSGATAHCTGFGDPGVYGVGFSDAHALSAVADVIVQAGATRFHLLPAGITGSVDVGYTVYNSSQDSAGDSVSRTDTFTISSVTHQTCTGPTVNIAAERIEYRCSWSVAGTYIVTATDLQGHTDSIVAVISTVSPFASCVSTDLGCYLSGIWQAITNEPQAFADSIISAIVGLPAQLISGVFQLVFGPLPDTYWTNTTVAWSPLTDVLHTATNCFGSDSGTHIPFPFSVPCDVLYDFSSFDVSPTQPCFDFPVYGMGHTYSFHACLGTTVWGGHNLLIGDQPVLGSAVTIIGLVRWLLALGFTMRLALSLREWMGSGW